jgi:hypothetical protein
MWKAGKREGGAGRLAGDVGLGEDLEAAVVKGLGGDVGVLDV